MVYPTWGLDNKPTQNECAFNVIYDNIKKLTPFNLMLSKFDLVFSTHLDQKLKFKHSNLTYTTEQPESNSATLDPTQTQSELEKNWVRLNLEQERQVKKPKFD